jgi:hypothetical protein
MGLNIQAHFGEQSVSSLYRLHRGSNISVCISHNIFLSIIACWRHAQANAPPHQPTCQLIVFANRKAKA